jgi:hypothetical protein
MILMRATLLSALYVKIDNRVGRETIIRSAGIWTATSCQPPAQWVSVGAPPRCTDGSRVPKWRKSAVTVVAVAAEFVFGGIAQRIAEGGRSRAGVIAVSR